MSKEYKKELLGFTAGNFDLLHPGYIYCFKDAKQYCDKFIIFLQIDPSLHRKSKYKPVIPVYDRYKALKSIRYIDEVYTYQTEEELYNLIKFFSDNLSYNSEYKLVSIILLVIVTFIIYILTSILTKAFKISDIKLKY